MSLDSLSHTRFVESSITISNSGGYVIGFRLSMFFSLVTKHVVLACCANARNANAKLVSESGRIRTKIGRA